MTGASTARDGEAAAAARIERPEGRGPVVLLCDHASNRIPARLGTLGLPAAALDRHFAWDPGALGLARGLSAALDAPLVLSTVSRLVIDCNRDPGAADSIVAVGEGTPVPGNGDLDAAERARRIAEAYEPFHAAAAAAVGARRRDPAPFALCAVHSFTPVLRGVARPWHVGVLFGDDERFARAVIAGLAADRALQVGINEPYSPADGVFHTLERHGVRAGLPTVMLEIRNDLVADAAAEQAWAGRLAPILAAAARDLFGTKTAGKASG